MTATTIRELYEVGYVTRLATTGLRSFGYVPYDSEWPAAFLLPPVVDHEGLANNWGLIRVDVIVFVSAVIDQHQHKLLPYQDVDGDQSIPAAFLADPTLGLPGVDAHVVRSRPLNMTEQAGYQAFGALFETQAVLS